MAAIAQRGGISVARTAGAHDKTGIQQCLDAGVDIVLIPYINTVEEAQESIRHCLFAPRGDRVWNGSELARSKRAALMFQFETSACMDVLEEIRSKMRDWGLEAEFAYRGEVDRAQKTAFLQSLDVFSVPTTYAEPKGMFLLEAMANAVPVVQPRKGAFPEMVSKTGGGVIVEPDNPSALADAYLELWRNPDRATALGRAGAAGVREHYDVGRMAEAAESAYESVRSAH